MPTSIVRKDLCWERWRFWPGSSLSLGFGGFEFRIGIFGFLIGASEVCSSYLGCICFCAGIYLMVVYIIT